MTLDGWEVKKMRFAELARLFKSKNPDGECIRFQDSIGVRYTPDGKIYHYRSYGNYALAKKLGLVAPAYPEGDVSGPCVCGSWPGGECLKCPWIPA